MKSFFLKTFLVATSTILTWILLSDVAQAQYSDTCPIYKTQWTELDEKNYQAFVTAIGEAVEQRKCRDVNSCMKSSANPYRKTDPPSMTFINDCGKLSPMLRAYFACKNGLPFSLSVQMVARPVEGNSGFDIRYNPHGNKVASRVDLTSKSSGRTPKLTYVLGDIIGNSYSSRNYRFHFAESDKGLFADFYPTALSRDAIRPGTIIYDPNGHVVTVLRLMPDGRIKYIDSHPDNSLTTGFYGRQFVRSNPGQGAGFKNWRPLRLVGASKDSRGQWIGGTIAGSLNSEIPLFSTEQFFGTHPSSDGWRKGKFKIDEKEYDYYDYVRNRISIGSLKLDPVLEVKQRVYEICEALKDRVEAVQASVTSGINKKDQPGRLPENIYGTSGEWEIYSTPSRDARLKVQYVDLLEQTKKIIDLHKAGDPSVVYTGSDLKSDLLNAYVSEANSCGIRYFNSDGVSVDLNLEEVRQRLFKLSFDPYHCPELRWGASDPAELQSCRDGSTKRQWYLAEQNLRNQIDRRYDVRMNFDLNDLLRGVPGSGVSSPPDVDLPGFLQKL